MSFPPDPTEIPLPSHAYVPGRNARHAADAFLAICQSVGPGMPVEALAGTRAWRAGLAYLEAGYYWEAHEVLEPVWMALPEGSRERRFVQAVIQLANARLKARMRRPRAVLRLCDIAEDLIADMAPGEAVFGVTPQDILARIEAVRAGTGIGNQICAK